MERQGSVDVPYSEPDYAVSSENLGKLQFSLTYSETNATLTLKIIRAIELAAKGQSVIQHPVSCCGDEKTGWQ